MPGNAAVAIWCDVGFDAREEFDDWHAHEHMPERLAIPGFLRGSRWVCADAGAGYFMLYEARSEAAITSGPYLDRLNDPTPWSRKMMPHHRNMVRSLCRVEASFGAGLGPAMLTLRFSAADAHRLRRWLTAQLLPALPSRKGLVAAHLLRAIERPGAQQTTEQRLRGGDATADWVVLVNGYGEQAVAALAAEELHDAAMVARGAAPGAVAGLYRLAYVLTQEK
jgi:hypothetical protein